MNSDAAYFTDTDQSPIEPGHTKGVVKEHVGRSANQDLDSNSRVGGVSVMRFDGDRWQNVTAMDLAESDLIYFNGAIIEVTEKPSVVNGQVHLSGRSYQGANDPIVVASGEQWRNRQATVAVMDYTNSPCRDFADGTHMIAELEAGPGAIYSPRLPAHQLEAWCKDNMSRFKDFFTTHEAALDRGEVIKIEPWWTG